MSYDSIDAGAKSRAVERRREVAGDVGRRLGGGHDVVARSGFVAAPSLSISGAGAVWSAARGARGFHHHHAEDARELGAGPSRSGDGLAGDDQRDRSARRLELSIGFARAWLTGRFRKGQDAPKSNRASRIPDRYDLSSPENQLKLEAVEKLALLAEDAGITMIDMALGFVLAHPAVTSPIIGPRTMEQLESQLGAADHKLADDVLDRIDEIVPPGTTLNRADAGWDAPALANKRLRRRR